MVCTFPSTDQGYWAEIIPLKQCNHCFAPERDNAREGKLFVLMPPMVLLGRRRVQKLTTDMSSSMLQAWPEFAVTKGYGLFGLAGYCFSTIAPLFVFAILSPLIRRVFPDGFTLAEFIRRRYGWPLGLLAAMVFIGFMFCFMLVELNTYGLIVHTICDDVSKVIPPLIVAITTFLYTSYGGFKTSLWTDNVNAIVVVIFIIIGAVSFSTRLKPLPGKIDESHLLDVTAQAGQMWYVLTISIIFSQMFNQGFWQRAFASKNNASLWLSVCLAAIPLFAILYLVGMSGPLAVWAGIDVSEEPSNAFFFALTHMPNWVQGVVLVLAGVLSCSAFDTFQSAMISVIHSDLLLDRCSIWVSRIFLLCLDAPSVVLALIKIDIFKVFLVADLASLCVLPPVFFGLIPQFTVFNAVDVFVGGCGGFLTVFVFGTIYYHDAIQGGELIGLPNDIYPMDDDKYSVVGAFLAAPFGSMGFALGSCAIRIVVGWLYCRYTGKPFTMLSQPRFDSSEFVKDEDRVFLGIKGTGNPMDGHRLDVMYNKDSNFEHFHAHAHDEEGGSVHSHLSSKLWDPFRRKHSSKLRGTHDKLSDESMESEDKLKEVDSA